MSRVSILGKTSKYYARKYISFLALSIALLFASACNRGDSLREIREYRYQFDYEIPAGLNSTQTHVFNFIKRETNADEIYKEIEKDRVVEIKVSNARVLPISLDGDVYEIRKIEAWFERFEDPDRQYYDCAYTLDLNTINRNDTYIQLIPGDQDLSEIFEERFFNLYMRHTLNGVPQRSQRFRLLLDITFYE